MLYAFYQSTLHIGARPSACQILRQRSFHVMSRVQQVPPGTNQKRIRNAMPFFDADRFARLLEREGFSSGQARAVINALDDVVDESTIIVTADLVSKSCLASFTASHVERHSPIPYASFRASSSCVV